MGILIWLIVVLMVVAPMVAARMVAVLTLRALTIVLGTLRAVAVPPAVTITLVGGSKVVGAALS